MSVDEPSATSLKEKSERRNADCRMAVAPMHSAATQYMARRPETTKSRRPETAP